MARYLGYLSDKMSDKYYKASIHVGRTSCPLICLSVDSLTGLSQNYLK